MSNEISLWDNTAALPAHLQDREHIATEFDSMGGASVPKLKIKVNGIQVVDGEEVIMQAPQGSSVDIVIVGASPVSRSYYPSAYVKGSNDLPTCRSYDGKKPDADVEQPMHPTCNGCPMDASGSSRDMAGSKACRFRRNLAVFSPNEPDMLLRLSLASTSNFGGRKGSTPLPERYFTFEPYVKQLRAHPNKLKPLDVITTVMHNPNAEQVQSIFTFANYIPADLYKKALAYRDDTEALDLIFGRYDKGSMEDHVGSEANQASAMFAGASEVPAHLQNRAETTAQTEQPARTRQPRTASLPYTPFEPQEVDSVATYWREVKGTETVAGQVVQKVILVPANQPLPNDAWEEVDQATKLAYDEFVKQANTTTTRRQRATTETTTTTTTQANKNSEDATVVSKGDDKKITNEIDALLGNEDDE